jgi:Bacterial TSP3 repeat
LAFHLFSAVAVAVASLLSGVRVTSAVLVPATDSAAVDSDGDGLSDVDEKNVYHTDPNRKDSDRDGGDDGSEVKNGTNPRLPLL